MAEPIQSGTDDIRIDVLAGGRWPDPFALLGRHPQDSLTLVRTFQPGARSVRVLAPGAPPGAPSLAN